MLKKNIRGIILAGGYGSRLYPMTLGISKQLIPVYDKPMIYYPMSILMISGIKDILIISTPKDLYSYEKLFHDGSHLGLNIRYEEQNEPRGIAEAFILAKKFIGNDNVCLILGDNIFYGDKIKNSINEAIDNLNKGFSTIFGVSVENPNQFGVIETDSKGQLISIREKPQNSISKTAVSGLYFYTNDSTKYVHELEYSDRNELEITDLNNIYIRENKLKLIKLNGDIKWLDTGTYDSLISASLFFMNIEKNKGKKIACVEEIAFRMNFISLDQLIQISESMSQSSYGNYLKNIIINESKKN